MTSPAYDYLAKRYMDICCRTMSAAEFEEILDPSVKLKHQTNEGKPVIEEGREKVTALFQKYVFDNTRNVQIESSWFENLKNSIELMLKVKEDKFENGQWNRYFFSETTTFKFTANPPKIVSIETEVDRRSLDDEVRLTFV